MEHTVQVPASLIRKLQAAAHIAEDAQDTLEDFLLARDPRFIEKMRAARVSHRARRTKPLDSLKKP
jgi:hypothetical protein